jgi:hypothetical protein
MPNDPAALGRVEHTTTTTERSTTMNIPTESAADYDMNPDTDDLLFDGTELRNGMIVLPESKAQRAQRYGSHADRWCRAERITIRPSTINGVPVKFLEFIGIYADGYKAKFSLGTVNSWIVKKDSI